MCATPTATSSVSAERSARPADPSSPTAAVRAALPFHLRTPSTSPCARQQGPRGSSRRIPGCLRHRTRHNRRSRHASRRHQAGAPVNAVTYAATLGGHQAATPAFATERACRASPWPRSPWTTTRSAGGDSCFFAKKQSWRTAWRARSLLSRTTTSSRTRGPGAIATSDCGSWRRDCARYRVCLEESSAAVIARPRTHYRDSSVARGSRPRRRDVEAGDRVRCAAWCRRGSGAGLPDEPRPGLACAKREVRGDGVDAKSAAARVASST